MVITLIQQQRNANHALNNAVVVTELLIVLPVLSHMFLTMDTAGIQLVQNTAYNVTQTIIINVFFATSRI